jgi:hypothetical protein
MGADAGGRYHYVVRYGRPVLLWGQISEADITMESDAGGEYFSEVDI